MDKKIVPIAENLLYQTVLPKSVLVKIIDFTFGTSFVLYLFHLVLGVICKTGFHAHGDHCALLSISLSIYIYNDITIYK